MQSDISFSCTSSTRMRICDQLTWLVHNPEPTSGQYLHWTKNRATPQCWWCRYRTQTREHLFKDCPEWKPQQEIPWAEVKKETGGWKDWWNIRNFLADERCSCGTRLPLLHGCGKVGAGQGGRRRE